MECSTRKFEFLILCIIPVDGLQASTQDGAADTVKIVQLFGG
jgi:hypothetical protein